MAVQLPNVQQPFVEPNTGLVNRTWYLALLGLNNQVQSQVVVSVNISGNNGIQAIGGPITSSGVFSLFIGNLTCANAQIAGTVTSGNAVILGTLTSVNVIATTVTAVNVATVGVLASGTVTSANLATAGILASGTVTTVNAVATGKVTAVDVALSGVLRLGNSFTPGITGAAGWITVQDSSGTTFKLLAQL